MWKKWYRRNPPYEGEEPYLYFAFAETDSARVWKILRPLLKRGCRVWYCLGAAGSAETLRRRQERAAGAALTLLYGTDALCADKDSKSYVLVNQKAGRPILCLDPDAMDRRLSMGLREDVAHLPLYDKANAQEIEIAIIHAEGFSQEIIGPGIQPQDVLSGKLAVLFLVLAIALSAISFAAVRYLGLFRPEMHDELSFSDPVILSAMREAAGGRSITLELAENLSVLRLKALPESWDDLQALPALERIALPQEAVMGERELPEGYVIELRGGGET